MKLSYQILIIVFVISLAGGLVYSANHYSTKYEKEKQRADGAEQQANTASVITSNVLKTLSINNAILEANQHAKQQIALDAQGAASDIKTAVANDDCTHRPVPAGAVKRLHDYADSLRAGATSTAVVKPDR